MDGEIETEMGAGAAVTVIAALADLVESAMEVAVRFTVVLGAMAGAM